MTLVESYGTTPDGVAVERHTLERDGVRLRVLSFGALVEWLSWPGRGGEVANVVLGFADLGGYVDSNNPGPHFGATVGRYANRIAQGRFELDGGPHELARNDGPHHLHGGVESFDRRVWEVAERSEHAVTFARTSPDGEEGYPGALAVRAAYELLEGGRVAMTYEATCDAPTHVNLTNHAYFNLAGEGTGSVDRHELEVPAARYVEVGADGIPVPGPPARVEGTPLDLREAAVLAERLRVDHPQLLAVRGIDHCYVLDGPAGTLALAARLRDPASGRVLEVHTTEPGVQVYSGNHLDGSLVGTSGRVYRQGDGVALETQHLPDSPNRPDFPSTVLRPGEAFRSRTEWRLA